MGGGWFFWIAGVSLLASILAQMGTIYHSAFGLGLTGLIDSGAVPLAKPEAFAVDILAAGFYIMCGFFARKGALWAFLAGGGFYVLDVVLLLLVSRNWLAVAFHAYALFRIFQGFQAAQQLNALRTQQSAFGNTGYVPPSSDVWPPPPRV